MADSGEQRPERDDERPGSDVDLTDRPTAELPPVRPGSATALSDPAAAHAADPDGPRIPAPATGAADDTPGPAAATVVTDPSDNFKGAKDSGPDSAVATDAQHPADAALGDTGSLAAIDSPDAADPDDDTADLARAVADDTGPDPDRTVADLDPYPALDHSLDGSHPDGTGYRVYPDDHPTELRRTVPADDHDAEFARNPDHPHADDYRADDYRGSADYDDYRDYDGYRDYEDDERDEDDPELVGELLDTEPGPDRPLTPARRFRRGVGKALMITGGVLGGLVLLYAADLMISAGDVPRGVTVAGVEVGGMSRTAAEATLRRDLGPRLTRPILIEAGDVQDQLAPADAGLGVDWPGTLERAGNQPLSPITRILSFFRNREVGVATNVSPPMLRQAVADLAARTLNHDATEGSIRFEVDPGSAGAVRAYAVEPRAGQTVTDVDGAARLVTDRWLNFGQVRLPVATIPVLASSAGVHATLDQVVTPAISGPVLVHAQGRDVSLTPQTIAGVLQFAARPDGALEVRLDQQRLRGALAPQLAPTEQQGRDARIVFDTGSPTVQPSQDARAVDYPKTFTPLLEVLRRTDRRELTVAYATKKPALSTEAANALGIREVVGEFSASGLSGAAAANASVAAGRLSGIVLRPGDVFDFDDRLGGRTVGAGFAAAPAVEDGTGPDVLGGGLSAVTTALYNAAYAAGLRDAGHTAHSTYLPRYPLARDAAAFRDDGSPLNLAFGNDSGNGIAVQVVSTGSSVTVRLWGTTKYRVAGQAGNVYDTVAPPTRTRSGSDCRPGTGQAGFTVSDTRTVYDAGSGAQVREDSHSVTYDPRPAVVCTAPPSSTPPSTPAPPG